jgi:hypothetical protein
MIEKWKNGRKLDEPLAFQEIKDLYFAVDPEFGDNTELMEIEFKRHRNRINQAR